MPQTYTVKSGDNLTRIGKQFGVDYNKITGYKSGNPNLIYAGEVLTIPDTNPAPVVPTPGSGSYAQDLATQKQAVIAADSSKTQSTVVPPPVAATSDAERARIRTEEIKKIKAELEPVGGKPAPYKSLEEFDRLRKEQGIINDEEELASIRNEGNLGKQELRQFKPTAGEGVSEGGRIGMVSEKERNLNFRLEGLALREQAVVDRLNSKNAYIKTVLDLGNQDYTTSLNEYNSEYGKNIKAVEMFNEQMDDQQKDAVAGITTITNLLKDKGVDFSRLDSSIKAQLDTLSLKAGLPVGLMQQVMSMAPQDEVKTVTSRTDSEGMEYYDILRVKPDGSMYVQNISRGDSGGEEQDTIKSGDLVAPESIVSVGQADLNATRGQPYQNEKGETITPSADDKYANSKTYLDMLRAWTDKKGLEQDFFKYYPPKLYLNPSDKSIPQYILDMLKKTEEEEDNPYAN